MKPGPGKPPSSADIAEALGVKVPAHIRAVMDTLDAQPHRPRPWDPGYVDAVKAAIRGTPAASHGAQYQQHPPAPPGIPARCTCVQMLQGPCPFCRAVAKLEAQQGNFSSGAGAYRHVSVGFGPMPPAPADFMDRLQAERDRRKRAPEPMRPEESTASHAWENPRRLPWCAVCRKPITDVTVKRLGAGGAGDDKLFIVRCHGQEERTTLTAAEVAGMQGYGRAFEDG